MNSAKQFIVFSFLIKYVCGNMGKQESINDVRDHKCEYIKKTKDMLCRCSRSSMVIPSISLLLAEYPDKRVESLSFHGCSSLDLNISTVELLWTALYQLRVDNIEYVTFRGVELQPEDSLDIHVNNVKKHFNLIGYLKCTSCKSRNSSEFTPPSLSLQIKDSVHANIQYVKLENLDFRLKTRNVENIKISNSVISSLQQHGMEVFYTEKLEIRNSVFEAASNSSLLLNHVNLFSLDHTLGLSNDTFQILSNSTTLKFSCTVPLSTMEGMFYSWDSELCGPPGVSVLLARRENILETAGISVSLVITGVAAVILAGVILAILYLQKSGKLDSIL
eukprot:TRINITY_DN52822_c0_g1_i1.p1 TRINITY_DN52822_c0_g1~~TRINITY_DN52822_c0_g1_i1.p1  ORF type:complete len:333 (-),score=73.41 TRINITY_DN52822_c0_g1_i1:58-1056(-)